MDRFAHQLLSSDPHSDLECQLQAQEICRKLSMFVVREVSGVKFHNLSKPNTLLVVSKEIPQSFMGVSCVAFQTFKILHELAQHKGSS